MGYNSTEATPHVCHIPLSSIRSAGIIYLRPAQNVTATGAVLCKTTIYLCATVLPVKWVTTRLKRHLTYATQPAITRELQS